MRTFYRPALGVAAFLSLAVLSGCAAGGSAEDGAAEAPPSEAGGALAKLDPCTILAPEQLTAAGYDAAGEPIEQFESEPGCTYAQRLVKRLSVYRNAEMTLEEYGAQDNWAEFAEMDVNGRPAAKAITKSAVGQDICGTMLSAGGGVVLVEAQSSDTSKPFDACGESLEIAQQIEPTLPE